MRPELLETLPVFKVRPASDHGPGKLETGMPNFEAIAGIEAAARFLIEEGMEQLAAAESEVFSHLLAGLQSITGVTVWGSQTMENRVPTAAFTIDGVHPAEASKALAAANVAVWDGHNYAVEVVDQLGLADTGGVIRAGVSRYVEAPDVDRLLTVVEDLAR
jgi:selenocysteine lyase/cysteine desulfurase